MNSAPKKRWIKELHYQILLAMILGVVYALCANKMGWNDWSDKWITPWGVLFMNALKSIALPLILTSLIAGVSSLSDIKKLSSMGGKTIGLYLMTTFFAVSLGLVMGNIFEPGKNIPRDLQEQLQSSYQDQISQKQSLSHDVKEKGPLSALVDLIPDNYLSSMTSNKNMLQIVLLAIIIGIALVHVQTDETKQIVSLVHGMSLIVLKVVDYIMILAPIGVFSLIATTLLGISSGSDGGLLEILRALGIYMLVVLTGLAIQAYAVYPSLLKFFAPSRFNLPFFKSILPVQLLAFSTSSSAATLPVTTKHCEQKLGLSEETCSFVLPLGATINMDGTALYQAIAALFIAQATGIELGFMAQLTIVLTTTLASIGTAAVPGAGIIMLVIILESVEVPSAGIALILGVDRFLDMARTAVNVTGDIVVATVIDRHQRR